MNKIFADQSELSGSTWPCAKHGKRVALLQKVQICLYPLQKWEVPEGGTSGPAHPGEPLRKGILLFTMSHGLLHATDEKQP